MRATGWSYLQGEAPLREEAIEASASEELALDPEEDRVQKPLVTLVLVLILVLIYAMEAVSDSYMDPAARVKFRDLRSQETPDQIGPDGPMYNRAERWALRCLIRGAPELLLGAVALKANPDLRASFGASVVIGTTSFNLFLVVAWLLWDWDGSGEQRGDRRSRIAEGVEDEPRYGSVLVHCCFCFAGGFLYLIGQDQQGFSNLLLYFFHMLIMYSDCVDSCFREEEKASPSADSKRAAGDRLEGLAGKGERSFHCRCTNASIVEEMIYGVLASERGFIFYPGDDRRVQSVVPELRRPVISRKHPKIVSYRFYQKGWTEREASCPGDEVWARRSEAVDGGSERGGTAPRRGKIEKLNKDGKYRVELDGSPGSTDNFLAAHLHKAFSVNEPVQVNGTRGEIHEDCGDGSYGIWLRLPGSEVRRVPKKFLVKDGLAETAEGGEDIPEVSRAASVASVSSVASTTSVASSQAPVDQAFSDHDPVICYWPPLAIQRGTIKKCYDGSYDVELTHTSQRVQGDDIDQECIVVLHFDQDHALASQLTFMLRPHAQGRHVADVLQGFKESIEKGCAKSPAPTPPALFGKHEPKLVGVLEHVSDVFSSARYTNPKFITTLAGSLVDGPLALIFQVIDSDHAPRLMNWRSFLSLAMLIMLISAWAVQGLAAYIDEYESVSSEFLGFTFVAWLLSLKNLGGCRVMAQCGEPHRAVDCVLEACVQNLLLNLPLAQWLQYVCFLVPQQQLSHYDSGFINRLGLISIMCASAIIIVSEFITFFLACFRVAGRADEGQDQDRNEGGNLREVAKRLLCNERNRLAGPLVIVYLIFIVYAMKVQWPMLQHVLG